MTAAGIRTEYLSTVRIWFDAARAWLARAGVLATIGAAHAADEAAAETRARAIAVGDRRAAVFARWARVEVRDPGDPIAEEQARTISRAS